MMRQLRLVLVFAAVVVGCYYVGFLTASFFKHGCSLAAACGRLPQATHDLLAALGYVAVGVAGLAAGLLAHEAGHGVAGLMSGYRPVSFRLLSLVFTGDGRGRLRVRRYGIAGTFGQCLMEPPAGPADRLPVVAYNLGGIVANSLLALAAAGVACAAGLGSVRIGAGVVAAVNAYLALVNGIPSRAAGVPNDGCNVRCLRHDAGARRLFVQQLRLNAALQRGVRPAQVPAGWAEWHGVPDAADAMQLMQFLFHVSRLLDQGRLHQALADLTAVWEQRSRMLPLLRREVACELTFCAAVLQRQDRVEQAYGPDVARYAGHYRRMMSGKQRLLWAVARYVEHDEARAQALLRELEDRRGSYLMAGEVASDLAIMHALSAGTYPADAPPAGE